MNGDRTLVEMRRAGVSPDGVWVTDSDDTYSRETARDWARNAGRLGHIAAHLRIEANDIPAALDLRCVVGLTCHVSSDRGPERFNQIFDALIDAGASGVVGTHDDKGRFHRSAAEHTSHG